MTVKKAVIPAAGLGTRMLPIAKSVPKEMLPIVDKPAIQYLVEEAVQSGITDILIITGRGKEAIENHFDYSVEYEEYLRAKGKDAEREALRAIAGLANISFLRQKEAKGLGHAVLCARAFVGDAPFIVLYGDDVIDARVPTCRAMCELYEEFGLPVVASQEVSTAQIMKYSSLKVSPLRERVWRVTDMIEKPQEAEIFSHLAILGRALLPPQVFDLLAATAPGAGGEIQLTDAMKLFARAEGMTAYEFDGVRHDMGAKLGFLKANVMMGAKDAALSEEFCAFLKEYVNTL